MEGYKGKCVIVGIGLRKDISKERHAKCWKRCMFVVVTAILMYNGRESNKATE